MKGTESFGERAVGLMLKSLWYGIVLAAVTFLGSWVAGGLDMVVNVAGTIGLGFVLVAVVLSGAMVSGDQGRAVYATETIEDRERRGRWTMRFFWIGLPNLALAAWLFFL